MASRGNLGRRQSDLFVKWSGLSAIASGVLWLVALFFDLFAIDFGNLGEEAITVAFAFYSVLSLLAAVLLLIGLIGIYFYQLDDAGVLGLVGFLAAFIGTALVVGAFWAQTFGAPTLAVQQPDVLNEEPEWWLGYGFTLSILFFSLGWILFGAATLRSGAFRRDAASLLIVGAALSLIPLPFTEFVFAAAVIWLGSVVLRGRGQSAEQASETG